MMAQRSRLTASCRVHILVLCFLAHVATGVELSVNNYNDDFTLITSPGSVTSLSCLAQNRSQAEELRWYREDSQVDLKDENKMNISYICISPVSESDNGVTFTCKLVRDQSVQVSVVLDVRFPPSVGEDQTITVEEGKDVTLSCSAKSNPQGQTTWYKNNAILTIEDHYQVYQDSETFQLSITKAQKSDNGTYTCEVKSSCGDSSKDIHLIVEDKKTVFPTEAVIAAAVVVALTVLFGIVAQKDKIFKCFKKTNETAL
ncbi:transmembrane and immunoglobulin domain-containing protein 1 isoform X2 [Lagopus muta]|uniref:transmembrane and immunoglobulin domain-containing protein 1 isoform X1 n=1 Tax=Lagopus muta TaxID=64668 RepID=UPI00209CACAD|nr:transmembrane and immunoglobulin domain-containing protein 1 isoform X1 [Lagopus muta]XP_048822975.1 transmembrane and immunoglobulin domain-containing protein 1 isoform X1 [Lagopus muta]XP_048822976.1 transmembrane and immunoglobulin domain-containing protein 1 isoform X2 [Lagopus muta]